MFAKSKFIAGTLKARTQCSDCQRHSMLATLTLIRKKNNTGGLLFLIGKENLE